MDFIKEKKGYNNLQAQKAAYQLTLFVQSLIYMVGICFILSFMGLFKECIISFVFYRMYRLYSGGIHIKNYLMCFFFSFLCIFITIILAKYLTILLPIEIMFYLYIFLVWFKYVPQGTSQRPFRNEELKKKMKYKMLFSIALTILLRFISFEIYKIGLFSLLISLTLVSPIAYKLFKVKYDREEG